MTEIFMPKAGMDMKEGRLIRWLKEVGDPVEKDEPVMEIETDKITMEAEAPGSGILLAKTVEEDTWVPVLSVIGYIGEPGEKIPEAPAASPKAPEPSQQEEAPLPSVPGGSAEPAALAPPEKKSREAQTGPSAEREAAAVSGGQKQNPSAPSADSPILATPYAKKAARERGLDLKDIVPGRSDGVIRAADVLATPWPGGSPRIRAWICPPWPEPAVTARSLRAMCWRPPSQAAPALPLSRRSKQISPAF